MVISGIHSNLVSDRVRGKQYIAVPTCWGGWVEGLRRERTAPHKKNSSFSFQLPDVMGHCPKEYT